MPESLLTILKFCFLALLWLFFLRVLWAVWAEVSNPAPSPSTAPRSSGPSAAPARAQAATSSRLRVVDPADRRGTAFVVDDEVTVGRASSCQIAFPEDSYASQLHARVFRRDGRLWLEDLGSTNGTYLNAKPVTEAVSLRLGDRIQIGRTVLEVAR